MANLHFKLNRPWLLVWAQAIKSGSLMYEKIPMLSPMFKASLALKHASKNAITDTNTAIAAATHSSIANLAPPMPSMPFANLPQYPQMPFPSPFMGYGMPSMLYPSVNPFFAASPSTAFMPTKASPPFSPLTTNCTIAEFCEKYNLGKQVEVGLDELGFYCGDDLSTVTAEEYTMAGFKLLEWRRVLKAYRKLKHDN
jgi:hypothetical protein